MHLRLLILYCCLQFHIHVAHIKSYIAACECVRAFCIVCLLVGIRHSQNALKKQSSLYIVYGMCLSRERERERLWMNISECDYFAQRFLFEIEYILSMICFNGIFFLLYHHFNCSYSVIHCNCISIFSLSSSQYFSRYVFIKYFDKIIATICICKELIIF